MHTVDLNCDMGESFGAWKMGRDEEILPFVTSANIACGFHAGGPSIMRRTADAAFGLGVAVGAHPSFPDLEGFGRRKMGLSPGEVYDIVLYQVSALQGICHSLGGRLHHVKPHGALYNQAAADRELAGAIADAVKSLDHSLVLYGLSGSHLVSEAEARGLSAASEVFADRGYEPDGSLTPRGEPGALIDDPEEASERALKMASEGIVTSVAGDTVGLRAETICIHGDGPNALLFAQAIRVGLDSAGLTVAAP